MSEPTANTSTTVTTPTPPATPDEIGVTPIAPVTAVKESNEVFLGGMIVGVMCLLLVILAGTFGYFGYRLWQEAQVERSTPSIQELGEKGVVEPVAETPTSAPTPTPATPAPTSTETPTPSTTDLATLEVKVLNGGGARGSASTLTELLKKAGYAKAAFGNTVADHTGTVIYYAASSQGDAETLKATVAKTYPSVTTSPAKAGDKDATSAAVVVVLGK